MERDAHRSRCTGRAWKSDLEHSLASLLRLQWMSRRSESQERTFVMSMSYLVVLLDPSSLGSLSIVIA